MEESGQESNVWEAEYQSDNYCCNLRNMCVSRLTRHTLSKLNPQWQLCQEVSAFLADAQPSKIPNKQSLAGSQHALNDTVQISAVWLMKQDCNIYIIFKKSSEVQ